MIFPFLMHIGISLFAREKIRLDFVRMFFVFAEPALTSFLVTSSERSWELWTKRLSPPGGSTLCSLPSSFSSLVESAVCFSQASQLSAPHR